MAQTPVIVRQEGEMIDYTPDSNVAYGAVVVLSDRLVTVAPRAITAGELGALATCGGFRGPKVTGTIDAGDALYWDDNANPVGGTAGSGALTTNSSLGPFAGWATADAGSSDETVDFLLESRDASTTTLRSALGQDDLVPYSIPVTRLQATGTGAQLGATAGTPSGAFGLTVGTHGSASPKVVGEAASANSKTNKARFQFALPAEYVSEETITLRVKARITGNVQVAQTIDATCYKSDGAAGVGSDLVSTAAQSLTTSFANYDFTITPTGLAAGDLLDIELTGVANDTGGTANKLIEIGAVQMLLDIKG